MHRPLPRDERFIGPDGPSLKFRHDGGDSGSVDAGRDAGASFAGTWTVATADVAAASLRSLTLAAGGTYTQTGRTDGESGTGAWSEPPTLGIDPDFGSPPAGVKTVDLVKD